VCSSDTTDCQFAIYCFVRFVQCAFNARSINNNNNITKLPNISVQCNANAMCCIVSDRIISYRIGCGAQRNVCGVVCVSGKAGRQQEGEQQDRLADSRLSLILRGIGRHRMWNPPAATVCCLFMVACGTRLHGRFESRLSPHTGAIQCVCLAGGPSVCVFVS